MNDSPEVGNLSPIFRFETMDDDVHNGSLKHSHHLQHHHKHHHNHHPHHIHHRHISSGEDGGEEEELDPRIQVELEKLNRATEEINRLELELDDARASFRQVLSDSSQRLNGLAKKLGACVDKARPYYDARIKLKEAHLESQKAAIRFERACSMHEAAKEMVQLAEEGYQRREEDLDPTWQEMLNHATMKVNDAERERIESEDHHQSTTFNFKKREEEVQKLQRDLKRAITKSRPYFEMKAKFNQVMEDHKRNVSRLEEDVASTKSLYSEALRNLEAISDDIHRQRLERRQKMQLGIRGPGVGAESPSPPPSWEKDINIDGSAFPDFGSDGEEDMQGTMSKNKKRWKDQGIVGYDLPLCIQTEEAGLDNSSLKSDPLNLVIFKTDSHPHHHEDGSFGFHPTSAIQANAKCARSPSYRQAVGHTHTGKVDSGNTNPNGEEVISNPQKNLSSMSPQTLRRREAEAMQSSLSRAQEWVNKSPVPQQRRFIKSKSLIDASSPKTIVVSSVGGTSSNFSPPPSTPPSSSPKAASGTSVKPPFCSSDASTTSQTPSALSVRLSEQQQQHCLPNSTQQQHQQPHFQYSPAATTMASDTTAVAIQIQPHLQSLHASPSPPTTASCTNPSHLLQSKSSPRSVSSTSGQSSPQSGSPSGKSPKLQGLILRVDAAGIINSPPTSTPPVSSLALTHSHIPSSNASQQNPNSPVVMSKQIPALGVLTHQHIASSSIGGTTKTSVTVASSSSSSSATSPPTYLLNTPTSSSSLHVFSSSTSPGKPSSKATSPSLVGGFKLPSYSSKTAPPSAFHLPSPTRTRITGLSSIPPPALRQVVSPTPPSPSVDRVSILSGRSDSSKGGLLRPPSDSSDTESIASTGPMLDDDQVEFLTMDFNEQSISSSAQNPTEDGGDFMEDNQGHLQRGNWSRMSLPPRLTYLGGYLERARHMTHAGGGGGGVVCDDPECGRNGKEGEGSDDEDDDMSPQVGDSSEMLRDLESEEKDNGVERENKEDIDTEVDSNTCRPSVGIDSGEVGVIDEGEGGNTSLDVCIKLEQEEAGKVREEVVGEETSDREADSCRIVTPEEEETTDSCDNEDIEGGEEKEERQNVKKLDIEEGGKIVETDV